MTCKAILSVSTDVSVIFVVFAISAIFIIFCCFAQEFVRSLLNKFHFDVRQRRIEFYQNVNTIPYLQAASANIQNYSRKMAHN